MWGLSPWGLLSVLSQQTVHSEMFIHILKKGQKSLLFNQSCQLFSPRTNTLFVILKAIDLDRVLNKMKSSHVVEKCS